MKELAFEGRKGKAQVNTHCLIFSCTWKLIGQFIQICQDRLKTAEEIIAEEKLRLEKLEQDRIRRMKGDFDPVIDGDEEEQDGEKNSVSCIH